MRSVMKVFALLAVSSILFTASVLAQDEVMLPVGKTAPVAKIAPPTASVKYEAIVYTFRTNVSLNVAFESVSPTVVKVSVKALSPLPYYDVSVQWSFFPPCPIDLGSEGTGTLILNTETGYAEK